METTAQSPTVFDVKKTAGPAWIPDGSAPDSVWSESPAIDAFILPWNEEPPQRTVFQARWDDDFFYFRFEVEDDELHAEVVNNHKMEAVNSDRVEIFFKADDAMNPYYCLEMDYLGRVLDYKAEYYRRMDYGWEWPEGLDVAAAQTPFGYVLTGRISLASLGQLGLLRDNTLQAGLFRADYKREDVSGQVKVKWISWIHPATAKPDFHLPSAFGLLRLVE